MKQIPKANFFIRKIMKRSNSKNLQQLTIELTKLPTMVLTVTKTQFLRSKVALQVDTGNQISQFQELR